MGKKTNHNEKLKTLYIVSQKQKDEVHKCTHNPSMRVHVLALLAWSAGSHENFNWCLLDSHGKNWSMLAFLLFHVPDPQCSINIFWRDGNKVAQN